MINSSVLRRDFRLDEQILVNTSNSSCMQLKTMLHWMSKSSQFKVKITTDWVRILIGSKYFFFTFFFPLCIDCTVGQDSLGNQINTHLELPMLLRVASDPSQILIQLSVSRVLQNVLSTTSDLSIEYRASSFKLKYFVFSNNYYSGTLKLYATKL